MIDDVSKLKNQKLLEDSRIASLRTENERKISVIKSAIEFVKKDSTVQKTKNSVQDKEIKALLSSNQELMIKSGIFQNSLKDLKDEFQVEKSRDGDQDNDLEQLAIQNQKIHSQIIVGEQELNKLRTNLGNLKGTYSGLREI